MNEENTNKLYSDFPLLYRSPLRWGFECGDGWFDLLYELSEKLEAYCIKSKENGTPVEQLLSPSQVKEKFGALRYHCRRPDELEKYFVEAESKAVKTCIICSTPAKVENHNGWYAPLCTTCTKLRKQGVL